MNSGWDGSVEMERATPPIGPAIEGCPEFAEASPEGPWSMDARRISDAVRCASRCCFGLFVGARMLLKVHSGCD